MLLCKDCVLRFKCGNPDVTGCISYTKQEKDFLPINCYVCNASGWIAGNGHRHTRRCARCNGSGKINYKTLINEDFVKTASTEQLAEWIFNIVLICSRCGDESQNDKEKIKKCPFGKIGCTKKDWLKWLKQPHREE